MRIDPKKTIVFIVVMLSIFTALITTACDSGSSTSATPTPAGVIMPADEPTAQSNNPIPSAEGTSVPAVETPPADNTPAPAMDTPPANTTETPLPNS